MRRKEVENWLKTKCKAWGKVADVGGIAFPMNSSRVLRWNPDEVVIIDEKKERNGIKTDYLCDLSQPLATQNIQGQFDVVFCIEVMQFMYDPIEALNNINALLKPGGTLYISFHLTHPPMKGNDYLRYTKQGVECLLTQALFDIKELLGEDYFFVTAIKR